MAMRGATACGWISGNWLACRIPSRTGRSIRGCRPAPAANRFSGKRVRVAERGVGAALVPQPGFPGRGGNAVGPGALLHRCRVLRFEGPGAAVPGGDDVRILSRGVKPGETARRPGRSAVGKRELHGGRPVSAGGPGGAVAGGRGGAVDLSLMATDHIDNPRAIGAFWQMAARMRMARQWGREKLGGASLENRQMSRYVAGGPLAAFFEEPATVWTPRMGKDAMDSVGILGVVNRQFAELGMFSEEWLLHVSPLVGGKAQLPMDMTPERRGGPTSEAPLRSRQLLRNWPMARVAWRMRCSFSTRAKRTWPSPRGPNPIPGETATAAFSRTSLANSREPAARYFSGIAAHKNIVPRGFSTGQPARFRPFTRTSARFW